MKKYCPKKMHWDSPYRTLMETFMGIHRTHRTVLERQLNKTGVYRSQHQLLMYIYCNPNASQKEIAKLHHVTTATVAVSLKKLEQGGYIRRVVDQKDNRFNQICITEKGEEVAEGSLLFFKKMEAQMFEGFSDEELNRLQHFCKRIHDNLCNLLSETESEEL